MLQKNLSIRKSSIKTDFHGKVLFLVRLAAHVSNGFKISDVQKIIADKTSENGAERTFRCQFNLKLLKYSNTATYYLVIADEQGLQMPQREPFQIDIAFAVDEFDFFS